VFVAVRGLSHTYPVSDGTLRVLDDASFEVAEGSYVAVTGPSGAGKSTLLSILGGLERPQSGTVQVGGHDLHTLAGDDLAAYRRQTVGFVFQHFGLLDALTAQENVELACTLAGVRGPARRARARELLADVGLASRLSHRPAQLSGGERQRVAIARAMANSPRLLLADEPTGNLDEQSSEQVIELLEQLLTQRATTLIVVTHNTALSERSLRQLSLVDGGVVERVRR
jgi:putative ABC transport system ATP-binding protein